MEEIIHGVSGGISGVVAISVWYPIDILRLREQTEILKEKNTIDKTTKVDDLNDNYSEELKDETQNIVPEKVSKPFLTRIKEMIFNNLKTLSFAKKLITEEGLSSLYKGISSAYIGIVVTYGIYFFAYKYFKNLLLKNNFQNGVIIDSLITSFLAACASSIGSNPIWVLNTRIAQAQKEHMTKTNWEMIKHIFKQEGISGFYKGIVPALVLTINPVIQFIVYEFMKLKLLDSQGNISGLNIIICSIVSKLVTTLVTYPILTIKTLFQANENKTNKEIFAIIKRLLSTDGLSGLYKGISAKIFQTILNNVILMLTYEKIQDLVKVVLERIIFQNLNISKQEL